ncbi:uncharacterized protein N7469_011321 [Penicillium citrinum]|uniref:Uncharacterized protein n=1 Tax=Penicillium citrinum TaxID=5077 RepID=A0A9W9ND63_PENCI|nr:uncharacterized protein N7469_011321 [Penicillium citrinum]KAJ5217696.1 hypothetical protein N7469_011321 [Penicillium citrinum]
MWLRDSNWGWRIRQTGTIYPLRGQNRPASQRSTWIPEQIGNKPSNQDQNHTCMSTPFSWSHLDMEFPWGMTPGEVGVKLGETFRNKEQLLYLAKPWLDEQRILNTDHLDVRNKRKLHTARIGLGLLSESITSLGVEKTFYGSRQH